jgi:acetyl esterase/lipase
MLVLLMSLLSMVAHASNVDVYEPSGPASATVVFLHGGAWLGGDKSEYASLAPTFTARGVRFVAANYRLAPQYKHPAPVEDLNGILARYKDIYLLGHSAGAHMIAFWNSAYSNTNVRGFIGLEGIYDLPKLVKTWPTYQDWFVAKEFGDDVSKYASASPSLLHMKSKAPWLVIHSAKDELVDLAQSEEFVSHLKTEKVPVDFVQLKNDSHFGAITSLRDPSSECAKAVLKFISVKH